MRKTGFILFLLGLFVLSSCSTTSRLGEGEVLYTGVKKLHVEAVADTIEIPSGLADNIKEIINVPANNSCILLMCDLLFRWDCGFIIIGRRIQKGLKGWIYRKFVEEPVLMSDVRPDLRMKMVEDMLDKNGYFGSTTSYELKYDKKKIPARRVLFIMWKWLLRNGCRKSAICPTRQNFIVT